jgi:hypothetical protein
LDNPPGESPLGKVKEENMKKAFVAKSVGPDWPRWAAVIPDATKTQWYPKELEARKVVETFNAQKLARLD